MSIHHTAIINPDSKIASDVIIHPFAIIDQNVQIDSGCEIGPYVHIAKNTRIGKKNRFYNNCCIGFDPQDIAFSKQAPTGTVVGDNNTFREYSTIHRATKDDTSTIVGSHGFFMVNSHIAHDCRVGDHVIMTNNSVLAGHVTIEDNVILSAYVAVHQFCRVGKNAMAGAYSKIVKDVIPFALVDGDPIKVYDVNTIGLKRAKFSPEQRTNLRRAVKLLYRSGLNTSSAIQAISEQMADDENIKYLLNFIKGTKRGIL